MFEVQLDLVIPDVIFRPSLDPGTNDGFYDMVEGLLNDIYRISSLVPRLAKHSGFPHYQVWWLWSFLVPCDSTEALMSLSSPLLS